MDKITLKFKFHSLLHNHDQRAVDILTQNGLIIKYNDYLKDVEESVVNTISLQINKDDSIDYIKKKLTLQLFDEIKTSKGNKTCFYCFNDDTEVLKLDNLEKEEIEEDVFTQFTFGMEDEELKEDLDLDLDLEDEDLDLDLEDEDLDLDLEDEDLEDDMSVQVGAGKKDEEKIMICHSCKKIYLFKKYFSIEDFDTYDDIFPLPELFYIWYDSSVFGFDIVDSQRRKIEYKIKDVNLQSPYTNIDKINRKFLLNKKGNKLTQYFNLVMDNDIKINKFVKNNSFLLYNNLDLDNETNDINIAYMPELALFNLSVDNKCYDAYSKLYFPYINYSNYFLKFMKKNMKASFLSCINEKNKNINFNKYTPESILNVWGENHKMHEQIIENFSKIDEYKEYEEYTNKVFYKINENINTNSLINFSNIYHLFDLDENIPYLTSYLAEEAVVLEKYFKPLAEELKIKQWNLFNKNIIQFKLLMPKGLINKDKHYFQVNLYENMKLDVSIPIQSVYQVYLKSSDLEKINNKVIGLIKRLNKYNIFNFSGLKIPIPDNNFKDWNTEKSLVEVNSMNFYLKIKLSLNEKMLLDSMNMLKDCMSIYYHRDYNINENDFRYKRINNVGLSDITDRFIYHMRNLIIEEFNLEDEDKIGKELIKNLMSTFDKTHEEAESILINYRFRYKSFIKPSNYGIYFNIKEKEEWKDIESKFYTYKISIMGMRSYDDWKKMKGFLLQLFNLINILNSTKQPEYIKKIKNLCHFDLGEKMFKKQFKKSSYIEHQQEKFQCNTDLQIMDEDIKISKNRADKKKLEEHRNKIKKRLKELKIFIDEKKKAIKDNSSTSISTYISRLQTVYPNLKIQCDDKGNTMYSKNCQKSRQPMGTGNGIQPEIIEYNEDYEKERMADFSTVTCNIEEKKEQKGGAINDEEKTFEITNIKDKNIIDFLIKKLEVRISLGEKKGMKVKALVEEMAKIFKNNTINIHRHKYLKTFDISSLFDLYNITDKKDQDLIILNKIYRLTDKWSNQHMKNLYKTIINVSPNEKSIREIKRKINKFFSKFKTNIFNSIPKDTKVESFEEFSKNLNIIVRKDKNNNIIQSSMSYKGKAISCPNYDDKNNNRLVGFVDFSKFDNKDNLSDRKIREKVCQPCCFSAKKNKETGNTVVKPNYKRSMQFCKGKISWNNYMKIIDEEEKTINYISTLAAVNRNGSYGKLTPTLHSLFNNFERINNTLSNKNMPTFFFKKFKNNLLKSPGFVSVGIKQLNNSVITILSYLLNITEMQLIQGFEKKLKQDKLLFSSLNEGKIGIKFKTIDNYIKYLKGEDVDIRWLIDLMASSGIFHKEGFNIIIFKEKEDDIKIKKHNDIIFTDYYNQKSNHIFIYEYENGNIEPIIMKMPGKVQRITVFNENNIEDYKRMTKIPNETYFSDLLKFIGNWVNITFKSKIVSAKNMVNILRNKSVGVKTQIIDSFNKVLYIQTNNNDIIPVFPSKIVEDLPTKLIKNAKDLDLVKFDKQMDKIDNYVKILGEQFEFSKIVLDDDEVVAIELDNKLMIPIIREHISKFNKKYIKSRNKLFFEINTALFEKKIPIIDLDLIRENVDLEIYQRILLEFSMHIHTSKRKDEILKKIKDNSFESKKDLKKIISEIYNNIFTFKEEETINVTKMNKVSENIRETCSSKKTSFCEKGKLIVSYTKRNIFLGLLMQSIISNKQMRDKILNNDINRIVDITRFEDDKIHIYIKKDVAF